MRLIVPLGFALLAPFCSIAQVWLDPSFGTAGIADHDFGPLNDQAVRVLLQTDGKLVTVGSIAVTGGTDFLVARSNSDGSPDDTFGAGGSMTFNIGSQDVPTDAALQEDGKIVVVGYANPGPGRDKAILRFNADGTVDSGFGTGGSVLIDGSYQEDELNGVVIQPDQKIVTVGQGFNGSKDTFYIGRLKTNGDFDSTFATNGQFEHTITGDNCKANEVALMSDGRIVSVGTSYTDNTTLNDLVVVRYLPDGTLDTAFDADGKAVFSFSTGTDEGTAVAVQDDGSVVAGGVDDMYVISLVRLLQDGSVDDSFGTSGMVQLADGEFGTHCQGLLIDASGRIMVDACEKPSSGSLQDDLFRLMTDGSPDPDWGTAGELVHAVDLQDVNLPGMVMQPDEKIVLAGSHGNSGSHETRLIRYLGSALTGIEEQTPSTARLISVDRHVISLSLPRDGAYAYDLCDAEGRLLAEGTQDVTSSSGTRIDLTDPLVPGLYLVSLRNARQGYVLRFVVAQ